MVAPLWLLLPGSTDLLLLVVVCFPQAGARTRARERLLCHRSTSAALMKLDKWIRGAQIWAGIFEKKTTEMLEGSGGWRRTVKG